MRALPGRRVRSGGSMITIKVQKASFHPQPRLEIDGDELRFVSGVFTEPLKVPVSGVGFVDQAMSDPSPQPVPAIIPRIPVIRTGSNLSHNPNMCLIFSVPLRVPPAKLVQIGTVPFSVARARRGEVWIDGLMIGCSDAGQAREQLLANGIRAFFFSACGSRRDLRSDGRGGPCRAVASHQQKGLLTARTTNAELTTPRRAARSRSARLRRSAVACSDDSTATPCRYRRRPVKR